jgi:hypothetical protein
MGGPDKNPGAPLESLIKAHGQQKGNLLARQLWNFRKLYGDPSFTPDILSTIKANALIIQGTRTPSRLFPMPGKCTKTFQRLIFGLFHMLNTYRL